MPESLGGRDEGMQPFDPSYAPESAQDESETGGPYAEVEPGWRAVRSLMQLRSDELLSLMLRPSFRPVRDLELVQVAPCPYCRDGGLRTAGSVRVRRGRVAVRACDTCATVDVGDQPYSAPHSA